MKTKRITTEKVRRFQEATGYWHEGVDLVQLNNLGTYLTTCPWMARFYWTKGKSYVFQDQLDSNVYCITKTTFDKEVLGTPTTKSRI